MTHGGGGQGTHMMGIGGRPGWVHYFVQAGYAVYWLDRPSYGRSPYHPDALGPSHLPNVPPLRGADHEHGRVQHRAVARARRHERSADRSVHGLRIRQRVATKPSTATWPGAAARSCWTASARVFCVDHAFGGFFGWGVADRRPNLVKAIMCMEINGNPFAAQLRWGLTAGPMTFDPPVTDLAQFKLVDKTRAARFAASGRFAL